MVKRKLITCFIIEILLLFLVYYTVCLWGLGKVKSNPVSFLQGNYEQSQTYDLKQLLEDDCIENATILEDNSLFTEDTRLIIRMSANFGVRSLSINVNDFINPEGNKTTGLTAHVYYKDNDGKEFVQKALISVGENIFNLKESGGVEYIVAPSNIENSSIKILSVTLNNFKNGYRSIFLGLSVLVICAVSIIEVHILGKVNNKYLRDIRISLTRKKVLVVIIGSSLGLSLLYIFFYMKLPHIIHPEVYEDFPNYANERIGLLLYNFVPKIFNNDMIEQGLYRPRVLAFIWQYFDTNLMIMIDKIMPGFGIKMPLTLLVIPISMLVWRYVFIKMFRESYAKIGILFGTILLFIPNIQTATYFYLRSAKIIAPIVVIGILNYGISHLSDEFTVRLYKDNWKSNVGCIVLIFILCTLDEQVIAISAFIIALSVLNMLFTKKMQRITVNFIAAIAMYIIYYKWWGRWLFEYFTPGQLKPHIHNMSMIVEDFKFSFLIEAAEIYNKILLSTFNNYIIIGMVFGLIIGLWFCIERWEEKLISISIIGFSFALTVALLIGLPILYYYNDMILSIYFICPILIFIYGIIYTISKAKQIILVKINGVSIGKTLVLTMISLCFLYNIRNIEQCHLRHLGINGGMVQFRDENYDLKYFNDYYISTIVTREQYERYMEENKCLRD